MNASAKNNDAMMDVGTIREATVVQSVINAIPTPIFYKDDKGRYLGCNKAFELFVGRTREELVGKDVFELWDKDQAQVYHDADAALYNEGGKQKYEAQVTYADGSIHDVIFHKAVYFAEQEGVSGIAGAILDITKHKKSEEKLHKSEQQFRAMFETSAMGTALHSIDGTYLKVNNTFCKILGYDESEILGRNWRDFTHPDDIAATEMEDEEVMNNRQNHFSLEKRYIRKDGEIVWAQMGSAIIFDTNGKPEYILGQIADITTRKQAEEQIKHMSNHDALTNLPNRTLLMDRLDQALARAHRDKTRIALMFLDLDNFKPINDTMGHMIGDQALKLIAVRLSLCLRETDTVGRFGGDEFAVIMTDINNREDAVKMAQKLNESLSEPLKLDGKEALIGVSIGISLYPENAQTSETLLFLADEAMYEAKRKGKNNFQFSIPSK